MVKRLVLFITLLASVVIASLLSFEVPLAHDGSRPETLWLAYLFFDAEEINSKTVFVSVNDKYRSFGGNSSFFADTLGRRHRASIYELAPRGWHDPLAGSFNGTADLLPFFSVENSLRDITSFIATVANPTGTKRVILFGSGYGGMLAALHRQEFPLLSIGAVVDTPHVDSLFLSSMELQTTEAFLPRACTIAFRNALQSIQKDFEQEKTQRLQNDFNLCDDPRSVAGLDSGAFWLSLAYPLVSALAHVTGTHTRPSATREAICAALTRSPGGERAGYAQALRLVRSDPDACISSQYRSYVSNLARENADSLFTFAGKCLELGAIPLQVNYTSSVFAPNGVLNLPFYDSLCRSLLGSNFTLPTVMANADAFNKRYGGSRGYHGSETLVLASLADPLRMLAPLDPEALHPTSTGVIVQETLRGQVLGRVRKSDGDELEKAREIVEVFLTRLLV